MANNYVSLLKVRNSVCLIFAFKSIKRNRITTKYINNELKLFSLQKSEAPGPQVNSIC